MNSLTSRIGRYRLVIGWRIGLLFIALVCGFAQEVPAAGEQFTLTGNDLHVNVDTRWVGCNHGGYCPLRVRVVNRGPTRELTFRVVKVNQSLPTVRRTLEVPQNATLSLTLSVPMVSETINGEFRVEDRGGVLDKMSRSISLPQSYQWEYGQPGLVVVSESVVDLQPFEDGVTTFRYTGGGGTTFSGSGSHSHYGHRGSSSLVLSASSLPHSWIDYSGLDVVAVPLNVLSTLDRETRTALWQWTRCGGTLLITAVGESPKELDEVRKQLSAVASSGRSWTWSEPMIDDRRTAQIVSVDTSGGVSSTSPAAHVVGEWSRETPPFRLADVGFGKLVVFSGAPFPGTAQDWFWLVKSLGGESRFNWLMRHGLTARGGNEDFLNFLIPGIGGVPVVMFLVLITIFSIVIGPLNYMVLSRRKKLHLLILTIPAIAFLTSMFLFGYAVMAHGFSVKARSRSLTLVDQTSQSAVTLNRLSLYAGQAPSGGLRFTHDTAVFPIWPEQNGFEAGQVDWTDTQALTSGWLRSRTRTQFLTVRHRTERGRLEVTPLGADRLTVANGFEWGFEQLIVTDDKRRLFVGKNIPAGASAELTLASDEELTHVAETFRRHVPQLPDAVTRGPNQDLFFGLMGPRAYRSRPYYGGTSPVTPRFSNGLLERQWARVSNSNTLLGLTNELRPRSYIGLAAQTPHVELGVSHATEVASMHAVMGEY